MTRPSKVVVSDDYAVIEAGCYKFYFGYEHTICRHGNDAKCEGDDCNRQWAFVVYENEIEIGRLSASEVGYEGGRCSAALLVGISRYGNSYWKG